MFSNRITSKLFETSRYNNIVITIGNLNKTFYIGLVILKVTYDIGSIDVDVNNIFIE
ncbi:hypothetical protein [Clostridium saudiense]|uniref:hypothetical protein n=1 Tax=Clostridium saudiense TaxID=1414720 RepID=UPI002911A268|nr:hypothetical protein [Clostridium saudiense]MDU7453101.1 hypothetical protein [Clostridium saudiense]